MIVGVMVEVGVWVSAVGGRVRVIVGVPTGGEPVMVGVSELASVAVGVGVIVGVRVGGGVNMEINLKRAIVAYG